MSPTPDPHCDYCQLPTPTVTPGGTVLCSCGAFIVIVGPKVVRCDKRVPVGIAASVRASRKRVTPVKPRDLTDNQAAIAQELVTEGASQAVIAEVLDLPLYRVQRATQGLAPTGRKLRGSPDRAVIRARFFPIPVPPVPAAYARKLGGPAITAEDIDEQEAAEMEAIDAIVDDGPKTAALIADLRAKTTQRFAFMRKKIAEIAIPDDEKLRFTTASAGAWPR